MDFIDLLPFQLYFNDYQPTGFRYPNNAHAIWYHCQRPCSHIFQQLVPQNVLCFWKALMKLTSVKPKMSGSYHTKTNGSSEHSNKTVNQMLCFHVKRNQKGWVHALPCIHFQIINTVNSSTKFSGFQLHLSHSPMLFPHSSPNTATWASRCGWHSDDHHSEAHQWCCWSLRQLTTN